MNTLRELAAIRSTAEDAAGRILESAEGLLAFADKQEAKKAEEAILSIMTACGFHDLVGQRVTEITESRQAHEGCGPWAAARWGIGAQEQIEIEAGRPRPQRGEPGQHRRFVQRKLNPPYQSSARMAARGRRLACANSSAR